MLRRPAIEAFRGLRMGRRFPPARSPKVAALEVTYREAMVGPKLTASELRSMTTPEIALRILQSFPSPGQVLALSYMNEAKDHLYKAEADKRELLDRLSDGWAWLVAKGMLGPAYIWGDLNPNWQRTTERGDAWARDERAIARIVAEEQLAFRLHQLLEPRVRMLFEMTDYETAAFASMKQVEVRVRELAQAQAELLGTSLMQMAFAPAKKGIGGGPLTDLTIEGGEQVAMMSLFVGAIGTFKNPASHRLVDYDDPSEAAEVVLLADLLLRLLDKTERRLQIEAV